MTENHELQAVEPTALSEITRGEIDIQIATARRYPRSLEQFNHRAEDMIRQDKETAKSCIYRRPIGKEGGKVKFAEGKSIRMAEIVGTSYGNLRVGSILIEQTPRYVKARGYAHDLESNFASTSEVIESTVDRDGNPYSERMRIVVAKAALSKARRDATFQVVPGALCKHLETLAKKIAIGEGGTLEQKRAEVSAWIKSLGISADRVWTALGIGGIADVGVDELETLVGIKTAIQDGDTTPDEAFPGGKPEVKMPTEKPVGEKPAAKKGKEGKAGVAIPDEEYAEKVSGLMSALLADGSPYDLGKIQTKLVVYGLPADPMKADQKDRAKLIAVLEGLNNV